MLGDSIVQGWVGLPRLQAGLGRGDRSGLRVTGVCCFPQTFIDMEGSGFSGDLESLRVSVPRPGCLRAQVAGGGGGGGEKGWEIGEKGDVAGRGAVLWQMLCA